MNKKAKRERAKAEERIRELRDKYKTPYPQGEEANPLGSVDGNRPERRRLDEVEDRTDREDGYER